MRFEVKAENAEAIEVGVTVTMTLAGWERLIEQIAESPRQGSEPSYGFRRGLVEVVERFRSSVVQDVAEGEGQDGS